MSEGIVSQELLEEFIAHISDNWGTGQSSLGLELEFYERNDFDPVIASHLYWDFSDWVNSFQSPLAIPLPNGGFAKDGRDAAYARAVAIQVRSYFREKFGKPPLSDEEIAQFTLGAPLPHPENRPGSRLSGKPFHPTEEQVQAAVHYALKHYPKAVAYMRGLHRLAPAQGYSHHVVDGRGITLVYAAAALRAILPSLESYGDMFGSHEVEKILRLSLACDDLIDGKYS